MTAPNMSKFNQKPKPATAAGAPKSRWGAGRPKDQREPIVHVGVYRMRVEAMLDQRNPGTGKESVKVQCSVIGLDETGALHHKADDTVAMLFMKTPAGIDELKRFCCAAAGYDDFDAYEAGCDPELSFPLLDASLGLRTELPEGWTLIGRLFDVAVTRGKDREDGDYYRNFTFAAVADEEQDVTPRPSLG